MKYIPKVITSAFEKPNKVIIAPAHAVKIGSLALHEKNGITRTVAILSFSVANVLVLVIAGTEQPKPIIIGINALPLTPNLLKIRSRIKATRAIYPVSSKIERLQLKKSINKKEFTRIESSPYYQQIVDKYKNAKIEKYIMSLIATILTSDFRIIDYDNPDIDGKKIANIPDIISEEIMMYVDMI